jgi:CheY-like chemotaxis protein
VYFSPRRATHTADPTPVLPPPDPAAPRVLVVEDTDTIRTATVRALSAEGYVVTEARHGLDALQVIEVAEAPFDVVITDVSMPVMSGYKLGRRLAEGFPDLPVMYMSSAPSEVLVRCGLPSGPIPFLRKPFSPGDLIRAVAALIPMPFTRAERSPA